MRYHFTMPDHIPPNAAELYLCNHPVYSRCSLFKINEKGLAVIQQRYDPETKHTYWTEIDKELTGVLYYHQNFGKFFFSNAAEPTDGLYPTVTLRKMMWAMRMKPLPKEPWETTFDRARI